MAELQQLQLWARWLELQRDRVRVMAVMELEAEKEATECLQNTRKRA